MLLEKLDIDCDLSEASFIEVKNKCFEGTLTLVVSPSLIHIGQKLGQKYNCKLLLNTDLPKDSWYLHDKYFGAFSPGA